MLQQQTGQRRSSLRLLSFMLMSSERKGDTKSQTQHQGLESEGGSDYGLYLRLSRQLAALEQVPSLMSFLWSSSPDPGAPSVAASLLSGTDYCARSVS